MPKPASQNSLDLADVAHRRASANLDGANRQRTARRLRLRDDLMDLVEVGIDANVVTVRAQAACDALTFAADILAYACSARGRAVRIYLTVDPDNDSVTLTF